MTNSSTSPAPISIGLLCVITLASPFAMNVFNPALPDVVRAFGSSIDIVQLTLTLYLLSVAISQLLSGAIADRIGRRPLVLGGLVLHLLGTLLAMIAQSIDVLIMGRILQALGGGAALVMVRTIILDTYERDKAGKYLSYTNMAVAVSQTLAPTVGGYLNHYFDWRAIFYVSFAFNAIIAGLAIKYLQETAQQVNDEPFRVKSLLNQYALVIKSPVYMGYALTGTFITCAYLGFASIMPYIFIDKLGGTSAEYGNWFLVVSLGFFSGSLLASRITVRLGVDKVIYSGFVVAFLAANGLLLGISSGYIIAALMFTAMGCLTFGRGLIQPNAQSGAISSVKSARGTASGFMGFMQLMVASVISQLMPSLLEVSITTVFVAIWLLVALSIVSHQVARYYDRSYAGHHT